MRIIVPFWFEESSHVVLLNQKRYRQTISDSYEILNRPSGLQFENHWLMQVGASPRTSNAMMSALRETFDDRHMSEKANFAWASRSPDMNPLD